MWIITSGEDVGGGLGDINWWSRCWKNGSEERKKEVSLVKVTCRAGSNAANSRQSCSQRTASLRRDRAWSGEDGYQNVEPVKLLMDIMIMDLTSTAILPLCPYVLLPPWPQTSPWLCFKNKLLFFLWRWYENHQNNICPPHEDSMFPADSLVDKRDAFGSSSSEENRGDWHLVRCPTSVLFREHKNMMGHQDDNMVSWDIF